MARNILPKVSNSPMKEALKQTFIRPITSDINWRASQFKPAQMMYNIMSSNAVGRAALDLKFNYGLAKYGYDGNDGATDGISGEGPGKSTPWSSEFSRGPRPSSQPNPDMYGPPNPASAAASNAGAVRVVGEKIENGFFSLSSKIEHLIQVMTKLTNIGAQTLASSKVTSAKVTKLADGADSKSSEDSFSDLEASREQGSGIEGAPDSGDEKKGSMLGGIGKLIMEKVMPLISARALAFATGIGTALLAAKGIITTGLKAAFNFVFKDMGGSILKALNFSKMDGLLSIAKNFGKVAIILTAIFAAFDFLKGWKQTDGNMIDKTIGGLKQVVYGFAKSVSDMIKMPLQIIKGTITMLLDLFGAKGLAGKLRKFDLGKMWDGMFENIVKAFSPDSNVAMTIFNGLFKLISGLLNKVKNAITGTPEYKQTAEQIQQTAKQTADNVRAAVSNISNSASNEYKRARKTVGEYGPAISKKVSAARDEVKDRITAAAKAAGLDSDMMMTMANIESGYNTTAKNAKSSAHGIYQFLDDTWDNTVGSGGRTDVNKQIEAGVKFTKANIAGLRKTLGREPEGWEIYLAHQQGLEGARKILSGSGNASAAATLGYDGVTKVVNNGGRSNMTNDEYEQMWRDKYAKKYAEEKAMQEADAKKLQATQAAAKAAAAPKIAPNQQRDSSNFRQPMKATAPAPIGPPPAGKELQGAINPRTGRPISSVNNNIVNAPATTVVNNSIKSPPAKPPTRGNPPGGRPSV